VNILIRGKDGTQEVFGGITSVEVIDGPTDARNRVRFVAKGGDAVINLNDDRVELLPENAA
jgi:hypothetical protein